MAGLPRQDVADHPHLRQPLGMPLAISRPRLPLLLSPRDGWMQHAILRHAQFAPRGTHCMPPE
jgi:hypothetical protein